MTDGIDDGGPAFPTIDKFMQDQHRGERSSHLHYHTQGAGGMTLRDWFATMALQAAVTGHISHYGHENHWHTIDIAGHAYELADAMIAKRRAGG